VEAITNKVYPNTLPNMIRFGKEGQIRYIWSDGEGVIGAQSGKFLVLLKADDEPVRQEE
jgi:hypothetical protein